MNVTTFLLSLPPLVLLGIIVFLLSVIGILTTYLFRKYVRLSPRRSHNELVGYVFATLGGFYGLVLGFVVFLVWDSLNSAQTHTSQEGSSARALYRDIRYYPIPEKVRPLRDTYVAYVRDVVNKEFPAMEQLKPMNMENRSAFNAVFREMAKLDMNDPYAAQMFRQLNQLAEARSLRQLDSTSSIPFEIWVPLLLGGAIILIFSALLDVESRRLHVVVNGFFGAFIGLVFYIVIILDHPFTGDLKIVPTEYETILEMERQQG